MCLSEKQMPQVVVFARSGRNQWEALERACVRPRQVRYQAALRPDSVAILILTHCDFVGPVWHPSTFASSLTLEWRIGFRDIEFGLFPDLPARDGRIQPVAA